MNIDELQQFFDYHPVFDEHPQFLVDEIKAKASGYISGKELEEIQKTYHFAYAAHGEGKRLSGEPYIVHPLQATLYLMALKPDLATIKACILHDVLEDTAVTYQELVQEFGKEVANLCEGLVKVSKIKYRGEERQIETLKKTFLAMGKDLRVIFIKLVDRIHNIQTLHYHPKEEKRHRIADETLKIYVPIAKRLGLYYYQQFLENGAFRNLYPDDFDTIMSDLHKRFTTKRDVIHDGIKKLQHLLITDHVSFVSVTGRLKSPYRIWEKMHHKYNSPDMNNIYDMIAFRVITESVGDCYNTLGVIHHHFTPLIKKIKDYIAIPKFNDYKSLHTTVLGLYDFPVEIQIRTKEMDEIAEWGVAAHFAYAEKKGSTSVSDRQAIRIKKLQDLVATYTSNDDKEAFKNELNIELLDPNIFIYTQKGDIVELPDGGTVLDFAFRIHSDLGLKFQSAFVNGSIVPISHKLKTGDIVVISAFKNKRSASANRFEYLHTPSAKAKLTKFLRTKEREQLITKSLRLLEEKLKEYKLPLLYAKNDLITKQYRGENFDRLLLQLFDKQMGYYTFIKKIYKDILPVGDIQTVRKKTIVPSAEMQKAHDVIIDRVLHLEHAFCPSCKPTNAHKIIARSGKDGVKIHSINCVAIASVDPAKLLEAHRGDQDITSYSCDFLIEYVDKPGALLEILQIFTLLLVNIETIHSDHTEQETQIVAITISTTNPAKLHYVIHALKQKSGIVKHIKKHIY